MNDGYNGQPDQLSPEQLNPDQLNIETPEQVDLRFPIAGVGSRFLAILLDTLIQTAFYIVVGIIIYAATDGGKVGSGDPGEHLGRAENWLIAGFIFLNFLMLWGYFVLFEAFWHGQTPGKRVMKLRVLKDSGRSITLFESMTRNLLRIVDSLPNLYVVGLISMLCNRQHKRLGDFAAGTIVVHERTDEQPFLAHNSRTFTSSMQSSPESAAGLMPGARLEWAANESALPADAVARLRPDDLHTIELFFGRALDLAPARREELAERVAATMSDKMGVVRPPAMRAEQMLELIAYKMRGVS